MTDIWKGKIMLASGNMFDITEPETSDFTLSDVAYGLGRVCRFAGQTNRFYSVAEHSVHVARLVPLHVAHAAMLHDASEAFIGDVTRPLKELLPEYRAIEARVQSVIEGRFLTGVAGHARCDDPRIKSADNVLCAIEARELMPAHVAWAKIEPDRDLFDRARRDLRLPCDQPDRAAAKWLAQWHRYGHMLTEGVAA